ncbi:hypothetical protein [Metabacillus indicus]|uniref:hypothetical protein n=1 Tax=Metabacillus indicus TaxID=246786 RepID=UPI003CF4EEC0
MTQRIEKLKQDNPEQIPGRDGKTILEQKNDLNTDPVPLQELKLNAEDEKKKHKTKNKSSSEE